MKVNDRRKLIALAAEAVRKHFKGCITDVASRALEFPSVWASSGSLSLDRLCSGCNPGGLPIGPRYGRIVHVAGEWSTGKSLLLDHWLRSVIVDLGGLGKVAETEGSRDPHFANAIGLPLDLLSIDRPSTIEEMFDMFEEWHETIRKKDKTVPILYGVDSLDSTQAEKAAEHGLTESGGWHYGGGKAEAFGAALRRMAIVTSRYPTTVVLLNQTRDNVGVMFGPKKRTGGGNAPHFYASLELWLKGAPRAGGGFVRSDAPVSPLSKEAVKRLGLYDYSEGAVLGRYIEAKCTKTKMSATLDTTAQFYIDFRRGVHRWEGLAERLLSEGVLRTDSSATGDYEMLGVKHKTKQDWLNWVAKNVQSLAAPADVEEEKKEPEAAEDKVEEAADGPED